jgi:hypothetical protein
MLRLVKKIENIESLKLCLLFNTGEYRIINFSERLKDWAKSDTSKYRELLSPDYFKTVKMNFELGTIYWENGIDFCPDTLYAWSEPIKSSMHKKVTHNQPV